jgi:hypothetical protein
MSDQTLSEQEKTVNVNRRALLRTGGAAVVAGVAALTVAETVTAGSAQAAVGDPLLLGESNDSIDTGTALTSAATSGPTFTIENTAAGVAPLRLEQKTTPDTGNGLASGDLANFDGYLYYTQGASALTSFVYTGYTANQMVAINPQRILDSRTQTGRDNVTNPSGNFDSKGRLLAGHTIEVTLAGLEMGAAAAYCNLTVVAPLDTGWMTLWAGDAQPATSSINFITGAVIANFAVTGTSASDTVSIYTTATTHVLLDITAFAIASPGQVNPTILAIAGASMTSKRLAARARAGMLPTWSATR